VYLGPVTERLIHRQLVRLTLLVLTLIASFFATRAVAENTRAVRRRDAVTWYREGEAVLSRGQPAEAVDRLRRAVTRDPRRVAYSLALANALTQAGQYPSAEQVLVELRDQTPEDPDVNLQLARLEVRRGDPSTARRYYQTALNSLWRPEQDSARRAVRVELIRLLLEHGDKSRALSEILILAARSEAIPFQLQAARFFLDAGDAIHARELYKRVQSQDPTNVEARSGAGEAAFAISDYADAAKALRGLTPGSARLEEMKEVSTAVIDDDPLSPRLSASERRSRVLAAIGRAKSKANACAAASGFTGQIENWAGRLKGRSPIDTSEIEEALDLVSRVESSAQTCGPLAPEDRALLIIAARHTTAAR
jgi:tetratricopeptide (TPR) repeat protein